MGFSKIEYYYWNIYTIVFQNGDILALDHPEYSLSDEETVNLEKAIHAVLPFRDASRLYVEINLDADHETIYEQYAYIYNGKDGVRIFQYDNREHHPNISTHPHHMHKGPIPNAGEKDRAYPLDIEPVSFENVLLRIRQKFFS
ncbi:MAG: hypothetical protein HZB52_03665 [Chloroflexi bacterium]|nr:hypothetical protein [Chloroflexota bacterium]